jgi:phytol kinase
VNPWLGITLVLFVLVGLLITLRLLQRRASVHPELVRKLLHVGMGLVTLSFPWLFDAAWPVLLLGGSSALLLLSLRLVRCLKESVGNVVGGVGRVSLGDLYFPMAVVVLFLLYQRDGDPPPNLRTLLYVIPVLLLTLADASAALVGIRYGTWHYITADGAKSAEGSVAFFTCAFFTVHVPLLLGSDVGRAETLLIALLIAWLATMFEAIAWAGLDNLVLPLVSYLLLRIYLDLSVTELINRLIVSGVLTVFMVVYRGQTTLLGSGVFGAYLVAYISWALGGWLWLLAPMLLFLSYTLFSPRTEKNSQRIHNIHAVVCVASAGLLWLFLYRIFDRPDFLFPYTLAFAAHLAIIGVARLKFDFPDLPSGQLLTICVGRSWLLLFGTYVIAQGFTSAAWLAAGVGLVGIMVAAVAFYWTQPGIDDCPTDTPRWLRQAADAGLCSLLGFLIMDAL